MTDNEHEPWDAWRAEEPSPDFASRTVTAALRARQRRRFALRRWAVAGVAATLLFAGAAWGFTAWTKARDVEARRAIAETIFVEHPPSPRPSVVPPAPATAGAPDASAAPEASVAAVVRPTHRHDAPPSAGVVTAPSASEPDAGRPVIVPRCDCEPDQVMCTCF